MSIKTLIWGGLFLGSTVGGLIPYLFGQDPFSFWGIIGNAIGGLVGIWLGYKMGNGDL